MHYRHHYHAGNFADVLKHLLLIALIDALNAKDKPWLFLDTHAGAGRYNLLHDVAQKTAEWQDGVGRLFDARSGASPELLTRYLALAGDPARYPGSPLLAASLARPGDRLLFCERVADVADVLEAELRGGPARGQWAVHRRDGYESAAAMLPPAEKRGLVLIDPPFEATDEFDAIGDYLRTAQQRFAQGQYAVWYPVKKRFDADRFLRRVARDSPRPVLDIRFDNGAPAEGQMHACGMLVLNPPWRLEPALKPALDQVARLLAQGPKSQIDLRWIKTEDQCKTS